jgi:flagellar basal-body rod protein FlgF
MIKGLYAAASAMLAGVNQQSILSHNVANIETPGFKQVLGSVESFLNTSVVEPPESLSQNQRLKWVGNIGLGVDSAPDMIDFSQGSLQMTNVELDFAIQGNGFFKVQTPDGIRYTRDGRFVRNSENQLVTVDGYQVLDDGDQPIELTEDGDITVSPSGELSINNQTAAQLGLASFLEPQKELTRGPNNTFAASGDPTGEDAGTVVQGYVEASNADATELITRMTQVTRQYQAAQQMVQNQDSLLGQTISTLGKM